MKQIGATVSQLAYGSHVHKDAVAVANECRWRCEDDLARIGVTQPRAVELIARAEARFIAMAHLCESPIEQMMLAAMGFMVIDGAECFPPAIHDVMSGEAWPNSPVVIAPQFVIARFRLDFLVSIESTAGRHLLAVECDGAAHHEGITDRRQDAERDEYLDRIGIRTLRLTGKWIYRNQWKVADELVAIIREKREAA
jgi:very-short-patch-repair endonuclease